MPDFSRPVKEIAVEVPPEHEGQRIDSYLPRRFSWRSRAYFLELLNGGTIAVNGRQVKKAYRVRTGDVISVQLPESYQQAFDYHTIPLSILYEDERLVVVDKPGNLAVQPTGRYIHENLLYRLRFHYREDAPDPTCDPCIVHRLDRETSGVIVFAKSKQEASRLSRQFAQRTTSKTYQAIVHGHPQNAGSIDLPLLSTSDRHVIVDEAGKPAHTRYRVLERYEGPMGPFAMVELDLLTGRQHQLRVHLSSIGHPIVSDPFYGRPGEQADPTLPDRQMLHAARLILQTAEEEALKLQAPLPEDMGRFVQALQA